MGAATTVATLFIIIATLAATGKVVVNALNESAWGMFTIVVTIPAALLTGFWMNKIRPGRIGEASLIGVTMVVVGVIFGQWFDDSAYRGCLLFSIDQLAVILPIYAAVVSILPVWVLLCPRDYLSSYMKVGVIALLGVGILVAQPMLKMPAATPFIHGGGPIAGHGLAVRVHRDRLRGPVGLPRPDLLRHDAEDGQQGVGHPPDRLRRDAPGGLRLADGADRGLCAGAGRLFQDQHGDRPNTQQFVKNTQAAATTGTCNHAS